MGLEFDRLPLLEVCMRVSPSRLLPVDIETITYIAECLRPEFPHVNNLPHMIPGVGPSTVEYGFGNIFGAEFRSKDGSKSLSVQPDVIQLAWRNEMLEADRKYPGFSHLAPLLKWSIQELGSVYGPALETFRGTNMSYLDFVQIANRATVADFRRHFTMRITPQMFEDDDPFHELNYSWRHRTGSDVRIHIRNVGQGEKHVPQGLAITTVAGALLENELWPDDAIQRNHDLLQDIFLDIITPHSMEAWGFRS